MVETGPLARFDEGNNAWSRREAEVRLGNNMSMGLGSAPPQRIGLT